VSGIGEKKRAQRTLALGRVRAMGGAAIARESARLADTLEAWPVWRDAGSVLGYLAEGREASVDAAMAAALARGVEVSAPRMDWEENAIRAVRLRSMDDVEIRRHGIREPVEGDGPGTTPTVVLVPGVAFDEAGRRLGRGAGFYDRFLSGLGDGVTAVGVALTAQLVEGVVTEAHDRRVHAVVVGDGRMLLPG